MNDPAPPRPPTPQFVREGRELEAALDELGIDKRKLQLSPKFTDLLMMARDGLPGVLEAMRYCHEPLVIKFLKIYDAQTYKNQAIMPWEAWCIFGNIPIPQLLGEIIFALRDHSVNAIKILAITHHPDTMRTRIEEGKTPAGYRERQAIDIALGFLPTPRGTTIIGEYYESGTKPPTKEVDGPRQAGSLSTAAPPALPAPPPPPPPPEVRDPKTIEIDEMFPDAQDTARLLND